MTPSTLPGEVWRGDIDGPVCVTMVDGKPCAWAWTDGEGWDVVTVIGADLFAAWAMSLRAEAQRAAEDMRERAAKMADDKSWSHTVRYHAPAEPISVYFDFVPPGTLGGGSR